MFCIGDSTTQDDRWVGLLAHSLETVTGQHWNEQPIRFAVSGYTAADMAPYVTANLPGVTATANAIWISLGKNDMATLQVEATWKAYMQSIINSCKAKWPGVPIYITRPWRRTWVTSPDTIAIWIGDLVILNSDCYLGDDERVWFENGDNGVTYSDDGLHPNDLAEPVMAAAKLTAMEY